MKTIYIDMDDVICDFKGAYEIYRREFPNIEYPQSIAGFFENLKPIKDAIEVVSELRNSDNYNIYILTAPSTRNPLSYTEKRIWVENYFDYDLTKRLIICPNKGLLKGDLLIDDNIEGKGQEDFEGLVIHFGTENIPSWKHIKNMFL